MHEVGELCFAQAATVSHTRTTFQESSSCRRKRNTDRVNITTMLPRTITLPLTIIIWLLIITIMGTTKKEDGTLRRH